VLNIAARDGQGSWIAVALLESADDEYLVVSARPLDSDEVTTAPGYSRAAMSDSKSLAELTTEAMNSSDWSAVRSLCPTRAGIRGALEPASRRVQRGARGGG